MASKRLLLVDGTGHLYRSFFAIKDLSRQDGTPTNAVFGFVRAVHQLQQAWQPTHLAVAWDGGTPVERLVRLPTYKAQRPPMPDALRLQIAPVMEFLACAGIPLLRLDRQEADDVLASLAAWAVAEGAAEVLIATSDKDLFQLVDDKVSLVAPAKDTPRIGREAVHLKTGVYPEQIVDWLALTGDAVDNIPGVDGVGAKTAAKLLAQFGSLDAVLCRLAEVTPDRLREKLEGGRARVELNRTIVALRRDLDCSPGWEAMAVRPESSERMAAFYTRMEFHSLARGLEQPSLL